MRFHEWERFFIEPNATKLLSCLKLISEVSFMEISNIQLYT